MTENNYSLIRDLGGLTEEQKRQHYENVCAAAGLNPSLNLLRYTQMDDGSGTGTTRLVLYATKGATNAIRDIQNISVVELSDKVIGGAIVFTAKAQNAKGRTDIAVGAAHIEGKRGKTLENAFALAQTRATRRVTLQLSGLDILDESEVTTDGTTSIVDAPLPLGEIGKPVEVSQAPGTDITIKLPSQPAPAPAPNAVIIVEPLVSEEKRLPNPAAGLKTVSSISMSAPDAPAILEIPNAPAPTQPAPTVDDMTKRRKRRSKAEMEAAKAEAVKEPVLPQPSAPTQVDPVAPSPAPPVTDTAPAAPVAPAIAGTTPTEEQRKLYVDRLVAFREECIKAGMVPSNGMGPTRKVREFLKIVEGVDVANLTVEQWDHAFQFLNETTKTNGIKELVSFMEKQLADIQAAV